MNKYESVIIIEPNTEEIRIEEIIEKIKSFINSKGNVEKIDKIGKRKLAYPVKNENEGIYILFEFESESREIQELQRLYRITEEIMKFIVINITEK